MPDISILVDIADYYDISISEIISGERKSEMMNEEERKIAKTMSDYATTEKEKIFKEMKLQSVMEFVHWFYTGFCMKQVHICIMMC